jgi:hypothetical protein
MQGAKLPAKSKIKEIGVSKQTDRKDRAREKVGKKSQAH